MDHFNYRDGQLHAESVAIEDIVRRAGTPCYVYATATLERHYRVFAEAFAGDDAIICFAVKANSNIAVIRTLAHLGAGADVVSSGELLAALTAGVAADRIVFSGVGKTREEMAAALSAGVLQINVESEPELELLSEVAQSLDLRAPVAIRINPDVEANTHAKIATGRKESKFGIEWTDAHRIYSLAASMAGIDVVGAAVHIGSQVTDLDAFRTAFHRLRDLIAMLRADGHRIHSLDLGGGLGIPYGDETGPIPSPADYADMVRATVGDLGCRLILEPGRVLAGNAGILVTRVLYVKRGATRTFVIVDAAMNDLSRPTLYGAFHAIVPVIRPAADAPLEPVDVVGPICETGDTFAVGRNLPPVAEGELLAFRSAGAYGAVMASTYNARPIVAEVLVNDDRFDLVRERMRPEDLLACQRLPAWLAGDDAANIRKAVVSEG